MDLTTIRCPNCLLENNFEVELVISPFFVKAMKLKCGFCGEAITLPVKKFNCKESEEELERWKKEDD